MPQSARFTRYFVVCLLALLPAGWPAVARAEIPSAAETPAAAYGPDNPPAGISPGGWRSILRQIAEAEFEARPAPAEDPSATWRLANRPQAFEARFVSGGVSVGPRSSDAAIWSWGLALAGFGPAGAAVPVASAEPVAEGNRVEYRRPGLTEWYVNDRHGLEQGFTILDPPAGSPARLELLLELSGSLTAFLGADAAGLTLRDAAGSTVLGYGGLYAIDAAGRMLAARMDLPAAGGGARFLRIEVDVAGAAFPVVVDPLISTQVKKLTAADAAAGDNFGHSVSISGDTIVVGADADDDAGSFSGSAYVFERNAEGADNWGQVKKLTAADAAAGDRFGNSVSISGDTIVVGAEVDDDAGQESGSAYVFERNAGGADNWGQVKKLTAADAASGPFFGGSVSISGATVVVGARFDDDAGPNSGSAYVFERNAGGADNWGQVKKLTAADAAADDYFFGGAVSISGATVVVGAGGDDDAGPNSGSAYVFERNAGGADNWGQVKNLTAADAAADDIFGGAVSISGNTVVVGARFDDDAGSGSGSAYVFERNAGGADNWGQVKKLTAADAAADDTFGNSVSISGDTVVVGARWDDDAGSFSGSAYVFERNAGGADNWGQVKKLTAADAAAGDNFGHSVSISGDTVVVGALTDDDAGPNSGSAYVFNLTCPICGDGLLEIPEDCDDGAGNSDVSPDACRTDCTLAGCGDGVTDTGETCDDAGESAECDADCTFAKCGDGTWNASAGEACDDGNTVGGDDCSADCSVAGTGVPGEASPDRDMRASRGVGANIDVTFEPACAATDHAAYWGLGPIGGAVLWVGSTCGLGTTGTLSFDPGVVLPPGEWLYFVIVGYDGEDEGNYGGWPEAVGIGACDRPTGSSTCE